MESLTDEQKVRFADWSEKYNQAIKNQPKDGDVLTTMDGNQALLVVELHEGSPPFIYGRAFVPEIIGAQVGWFLQGGEQQNFHGWKCILLPRARTELIKKFGLQSESMEVKSLKVVRPSQSGKSLLCEVHEYSEEVSVDSEPTPEESSEPDVPTNEE